jgi:hypothetical protein
MTLDTTLPGGQTFAATHRAMWPLGDCALVSEEVMARCRTQGFFFPITYRRQGWRRAHHRRR